MRTRARFAGLALTAVSVAAVTGLTQAAPASGASPQASRDGDRVAAAIKAARHHAGVTHAGAHQQFTAVDTIVDRDGTSHVRLHRTFKGLEVVGGDLVVHQGRKGAWKGASRTLRHDLRLSTRALVTGKAAEARSMRPNGANRGVEKQRAEERELVVEASGPPRLAWRVTTSGVQSDGTPSLIDSFVDARTGRLIRAEQRIQTADGSGQSLYSGTVPLQLTRSGSSYQLKGATRGGTYTVDVDNATDNILCTLLGIICPTESLFTSDDASFGNGSTSSRESAAVDAQYGTNVTWDYYRNVHGRDGIFGDGSGSYNRVHYGNGYVNAFWDGERMTYGDGDGTNYGPLTSLDVAGHEMSHGVTEHTAGLNYSGESGGLNEATSDIFGTMVEFYANNSADPGDYLIGEQFDLKHHAGFRRMDNPIADGDSPNCWSSGTKNLDVHYSSGVGNHFFYLLAEGSGPKTINGVAHDSPTCDGSTVTGIGRAAAADIWFRALTVYMTSNTDYAGARTATLDAARDLYGQGSSQHAAVAAAWDAVNVG